MEPQTKPSRLGLISAFAAVYIIWGSTYLGIKVAIQTIPPLLMSGVRYFIAGLAVYVISMATGAARPKLKHWKNTAIIGALLLLMGNGGVAMAETMIPSGIAALIVCSVPIWFALFGWLFFKKGKPGAKTIAGIILGFIGIIVLVGPGNLMPGGTGINLNGVIIITIGTVGWSMGSLFASRADLPTNHLTTTGMQMLCGGFLLIVAGLMKGEYNQFRWMEVSAHSLLAISYLIIFGSMVAFSAYSWLVRVASPGLVSTYAYVNPVIAVFLGWLFLHEAVDQYTIIGSAIIVGALILITWAKPIAIEEVPE